MKLSHIGVRLKHICSDDIKDAWLLYLEHFLYRKYNCFVLLFRKEQMGEWPRKLRQRVANVYLDRSVSLLFCFYNTKLSGWTFPFKCMKSELNSWPPTLKKTVIKSYDFVNFVSLAAEQARADVPPLERKLPYFHALTLHMHPFMTKTDALF